MPDVAYLYQDANGLWSAWPEKGTKYIRADLVPAAPTGDKAAALDRLNQPVDPIASGWKKLIVRDCELETIRAALQQDDSDLVKALEFYADRKFWSNRRDHHGGYSIFERDTNGYEIAEKALKGRKCSKCPQ
ncbi:hypothetical protein [Dyadobacter bucti]|uniref:hypothetical protein n=1 Tax=Dyadobacter bucti TaxID=2572203 RepID=UPI001109F7D1|nr:hypothetical protein [Dyadobacter bucti]